jgi:hypothetical protein
MKQKNRGGKWLYTVVMCFVIFSGISFIFKVVDVFLPRGSSYGRLEALQEEQQTLQQDGLAKDGQIIAKDAQNAVLLKGISGLLQNTSTEDINGMITEWQQDPENNTVLIRAAQAELDRRDSDGEV